MKCDLDYQKDLSKRQIRKESTKYGEFDGTTCVRCKGFAKIIGTPSTIGLIFSFQGQVVAKNVAEDWEKNFTDVIQPYRNGEMSSEFLEAYPEQAKRYPKEDVENAKPVWKDLKGYENRKIKKEYRKGKMLNG